MFLLHKDLTGQLTRFVPICQVKSITNAEDSASERIPIVMCAY